MSELVHKTVLLNEAVDALNVQPDGVYVDGTFGRGGHSREVLARLGKHGRLFAFDRDHEAVKVGRLLEAQDARFTMIHAPFSHCLEHLYVHQVQQVDGILLDLGISSPQIDAPERGFSFRFDAPLDMRMDTTAGETAAAWLARASEQEIKEVIFNYGEERFARQIAAAIVETRRSAPIQTTGELAQLCARCVRTRESGQNPATRTFQGIRIFINRELEELKAVLPHALTLLAQAGRLAIISFHSLEDRMVKQFMREHSQPARLPNWVAIRASELPLPPLKVLGKYSPSSSELAQNPRARSARLRVAERQIMG